jgi:SAM-dependent methyltransferase
MERNLSDYSLLFGVRFKALIGTKATFLQGRPKPRNVAVLGLGEGHGTAMKEIKREFGERVFVCTLDVARRIISKRDVDEPRVGDFETFPNGRFGRKFDFIFSVFGPTYYSQRPLYLIEKATALLEKDGRFFFQVDKINVPYESDVIKIAERTGCTYRHAETGDYYTFEFRKK